MTSRNAATGSSKKDDLVREVAHRLRQELGRGPHAARLSATSYHTLATQALLVVLRIRQAHLIDVFAPSAEQCQAIGRALQQALPSESTQDLRILVVDFSAHAGAHSAISDGSQVFLVNARALREGCYCQRRCPIIRARKESPRDLRSASLRQLRLRDGAAFNHVEDALCSPRVDSTVPILVLRQDAASPPLSDGAPPAKDGAFRRWSVVLAGWLLEYLAAYTLLSEAEDPPPITCGPLSTRIEDRLSRPATVMPEHIDPGDEMQNNLGYEELQLFRVGFFGSTNVQAHIELLAFSVPASCLSAVCEHYDRSIAPPDDPAQTLSVVLRERFEVRLAGARDHFATAMVAWLANVTVYVDVSTQNLPVVAL